MKKNRKLWMGLAMALSLSLLLGLAACGSKKDDTPDDSQQGTVQPSEPEQPKDDQPEAPEEHGRKFRRAQGPLRGKQAATGPLHHALPGGPPALPGGETQGRDSPQAGDDDSASFHSQTSHYIDMPPSTASTWPVM